MAQASAQSRAGDNEAAVATLRAYLAATPRNVPVRLELARYLGYTKHFAEALAEYQEILRQEPGNLTAMTGVGKVLSWQGDYAASLAAYERVLARSPWLYDARVGKGFTLLWMGDKRAAYTVLHSCAKAHPEDKELRETVAELEKEFGPIQTEDPPSPIPSVESRSNPETPVISAHEQAKPNTRRWSAGIKTPPALAREPVSSFPEPIAPAQALTEAPRVPSWMIVAVGTLFLITATLAVSVWRTQRRRFVPGEPMRVPEQPAATAKPTSASENADPATRPLGGPLIADTFSARVQKPDAPEPQTPPPLRVMVVDQSPEVLAFEQMVLTSAGCEITCAGNGADAMRALETSTFDAILLDGHLSGHPSRDDLLGWIRQQRHKLAGRVTLTCAGSDAEKDRLAAITGVRCLRKPIRMADLLELVRGWRSLAEAA
ncbi:MAG: tetratricopeptide repeat protein [Acidobacteriales bacterium]|nr:tetratricopeptide repeat protein [Terriglobales bacterium]